MLHVYDESRPLAAVLREVRSSGASGCLYLPMGAALLWQDVVAPLLTAYLTGQLSYSTYCDLPIGVSPYCFSTELLGAALALEPFLSQTGTLGALFDRVASLWGALGEDRPFPIRAARLSAAQEFGCEVERFPAAMDFRVCAAALQVAHSMDKATREDDCFEVLYRWKEREIERAEAYRETDGLQRSTRTASSPIRVLLISNPSAFSGAEESCCTMVSAFGGADVAVMALVGSDGEFSARLKSAGATVIVSDRDLSVPDARVARRLAAIVDGWRPHVIHVNSPSGPIVAAVAAAKGLPLVQHLRLADVGPIADQIEAADHVICVSQFVERRASRCNLRHDRISVIYNGVNTDLYRPDRAAGAAARRSLGIRDDEFVTLVIARFAPNKRHDLALRALHQVVSRGGNIRLLLVGESLTQSEREVETTTRQLAFDLGLEQRICWLGFQAEVRSFHNAGDVVVLCSDEEPLGRSVLEGMATGKPVVVSDSGGTKEIVRDGACGYVVPAGDYFALADRLEGLMRDNKLRDEMGHQGRRHVKEHLTARHCAERVHTVYQSLVGGIRVSVYRGEPPDSSPTPR
ncbi:MAG: glycosyltransferase family 4 protein [Acidobacteria bacterium]|nr:glycosyltransferase family 4 protein [Acidobacteriota bacterium]